MFLLIQKWNFILDLIGKCISYILVLCMPFHIKLYSEIIKDINKNIKE